MKELKELADKYGSDKGALKHDYTDIYTELFEPIRNEKLNILEMGVDKGASIRMWLDYFPNAKIFGLDLDENPGIDDKRYRHVKGSQSNIKDYREVMTIFLGSTNLEYRTEERKFDIIIDDCSHITELTMFSYVFLFPHLNKNGLYIIEDCKAKRSKYTTEILGKYGEVRKAGRDEVIIIHN